MCSIHLARALQCPFMIAAAINSPTFPPETLKEKDNFQLIRFNAGLHVRPRGICTYCVLFWAVRAIQFRPNAGFRDKEMF